MSYYQRVINTVSKRCSIGWNDFPEYGTGFPVFLTTNAPVIDFYSNKTVHLEQFLFSGFSFHTIFYTKRVLKKKFAVVPAKRNRIAMGQFDHCNSMLIFFEAAAFRPTASLLLNRRLKELDCFHQPFFQVNGRCPVQFFFGQRNIRLTHHRIVWRQRLINDL